MEYTHSHLTDNSSNKTQTFPTSALKILTKLICVWLIVDTWNWGSCTPFEIVGKGQSLSLGESDVSRVKCPKIQCF